MRLEALIRTARDLGASDLHLEGGLAPAFRVRSVLKQHGEPVPPAALTAIARELLGDEWNDFVTRGSADLARSIDGVRCRLNVLRSSRGVGLAIRLLATSQATLKSLNLHPDLVKLVQPTHGLVLICGPESILNPSLAITSTVTQNFNVNSVTLSGNLTVNNAPPVLKTVSINGNNCVDYSNRVALLTFKNIASGTVTTTTASCANPSAYSVSLVAGTYEVRIANGGGANVPGPESILNPSLAITSTATQNFNVNSVTVSGTVTVNNAPPVLKTVSINGNNCVDYSNRVALLTFRNLASGTSTTTTASCANPSAYSISLVSGVYEVRIANGGGANVPGPESIVYSAVQY